MSEQATRENFGRVSTPPQAQRARLRGRLVMLHRFFGVTAALFLFLAGLTGSILTFKHELDPLLNPQLFHVREAGHVLTPDALAATVKRLVPSGDVVALEPFHELGRSAVVYLQPAASVPVDRVGEVPYVVFMHPQTGDLLGMRHSPAPLDAVHFFDWILELHYTLMLPAEIGVWFLGILALFWLFDNLFGTYLAFPPGQRAGKAFHVKWMGKAYRINCDLHRVTGLVLLPVLLMLAVSSVTLNLPEQVAKPVVGLFSDVRLNAPLQPRTGPVPEGPVMSWTAAIARAEELAPAIYPDRIRLDNIDFNRSRGTYRASYLTPDDIDPQMGRSRFHFDAYTGQLIRIDRPSGQSGGDAFLAWMFPLHTGAALELPGRILIFLSGFAVAGLSITGLVIWWKKRKGRTGRSVRKRQAQPAA